MEAFREFILTFRLQHFAVAGSINLIFNALVMWIVVNRFVDTGEKEPLVKCVLCAFLLYLVSSLAIALLLIPTAVIFLFAVLAWLLGSMVVIRSVFQLTNQSGGGILFLYLFLLGLTHSLSRHFMG